MKFTIFVCFLLTFIRSSNGQEITIYGQRSLWHAENLCDINYTGCDWRQLNQGSMLGYAYHPNGDLLLILNEQFGTNNEYSRIKIFNTNIETCQYSLLYTINLPIYWNCSGAANIDYLGRLYVSTSEYDTLSNKRTRTLSRIANPAQPLIERVLTYLPNQRFWEVHFTLDRIYLPDIDKPYIRVYDTNFILLDTIIMQKHIWGLTSFDFGCDSTKTIATHMDITTQELNDLGHVDSTMIISSYNFSTNTLTPICSYEMGIHSANTQLTSPLEFLSSDPECELLIDLDRDNSTGVYPYDFLDTATYCRNLSAAICDSDIYIHTSSPLDSIYMTITGIQDFGSEILTSTNLPSGFMFVQINDSTYNLSRLNATDQEYKIAILSIRFNHLSTHPSAGLRRLIVQGFNSIKNGKLISCFINVDSAPYAGKDASILLCGDTIINQLSTLMEGESGGTWWPPLTSNGDQLNTTLDIFDTYHYIVTHLECGTDTATFTIIRDTSIGQNILGEDKKICLGDTLLLSVPNGSTFILWDDGSMDSNRRIFLPGEYWISTSISGDCNFKDTILIQEAEFWSGDISFVNPLCGLTNGKIEIDSLSFTRASSITLNQKEMNYNSEQNLQEGSYDIIGISMEGCKTKYSINLNSQPTINILIDTTILLIKDAWQTLPYTLINNIAPSQILFTPTTSIQWTGSEIEIKGDFDRTYEITFVDANGCTEKHTLTTHVQQSKGIYIPNIFKPSSSAGNDVWKATIYDPYQLVIARIYDRWGNLLYQSEDEIFWDGSIEGKLCQPGVYAYQVIVKNKSTGEDKTFFGDLTLMR